MRRMRSSFFFSSRRRHTRCSRDWSSDVCSSDLNARERTRPYCPYEKKDIGPEDYKKKGLPFVFDLDRSKCPNDGHELQVQNMTVMPSLRLSESDAEDVASYLITLKKKKIGRASC